MRIAVVASAYGEGWAESPLAVRRVAGALACAGEVEVLVPSTAPGERWSGALRERACTGSLPDSVAARALRRAVLGEGLDDQESSCRCIDRVERTLAASLPAVLQERLLGALGGASNELEERLRLGRYDIVAFAGLLSGLTVAGIEAVPAGTPILLLPLATEDPLLEMPSLDAAVERATKICVLSEAERSAINARWPGSTDRIEDIRFVLRVHPLARGNVPFGFDGRPTFVIADDWNRCAHADRASDWVDRLRREFGATVSFRMIGPGSHRLLNPIARDLGASRLDAWRWFAHSVATIDLGRHRLLGRNVIESLMYGTPIIVDTHAGAAREHADTGGGGLWIRGFEDLRASVDALLGDRTLRDDLGERGQRYAEDAYGDTDAFVKRIGDLVNMVV